MSDRFQTRTTSEFDSGADSGKEDLKEFHKKIKNQKEVTENNANQILRRFLEKKGSIETFVGELFSDYQKKGQELTNMLENEEYRNSDGFIREVTFEKRGEKIETLEKIVEWREIQIPVMETLLQEQNKIITEMKGKDLSREVLEELREVFDQKFESDKEKLEVVKETVNERIEQTKEQQAEKLDDMRQEMRRLEKFQKKQLEERAKQFEEMNKALTKVSTKLDEDIEDLTLNPETVQRLEELGGEIPENVKPEQTHQTQTETQQQKESREETTKTTKTSGNDTYDYPKSWEEEGRAKEDWEDKIDLSKEPDPAYGYTHNVNPGEVSIREWEVLKGLDYGCESFEDLSRHSDAFGGLGDYPTTPLNQLVRSDIINKEDLPAEIQEKVQSDNPE